MTDETTTAVARQEPTLTPFEVIERVLTAGDLSTMAPEDRIAFYWRTCESLGLNPLTRPFEFISLNNRLTLYARKDATDQLRRINGVSVVSLRREVDSALGLLTVYASVRDAHGRTDESAGVVSTKGLGGEALANAVMKAETKAKRRATLSLVGLGFLDESEVDAGQAVDVDPDTGVITDHPKPATLLEAVQAQQEAMAAPAAQQPAADAEVAAGATTADDGQPDAPAVAEGQLAAALTQEEFTAALTEHRIAVAYAAEVARAMFPEATSRKPLTDEQRAQLLAALLADG